MEPLPFPAAATEPAPRELPAERLAERLAIPPGVLLFAATTFASAFLIFLVQPIVAKRIVPWFGGVPAVWSLCLAFYQTMLFAGYAYAYLLIARAGPRTQLAVHAAVVAAAALALPVLPGEAWRPEGTEDPTAQILAMLLANVALPFLALAATGPLVAVWFSRRYATRSPYPLYAVSNLGSLIALLAYPFALEPRLPLSTTGQLWSGAFLATGAAVIACAALASRTRAAAAPELAADAGGGTEPTPVRIALWVLLSACAVVLLMGVTNHLCLDVASIPFLWIVPLTIYLATLIVCFGAPRLYLPDPVRAARGADLLRDRHRGAVPGRKFRSWMRSAGCCSSRSRGTDCSCSRPAWCSTASSTACARPRARSPPTISALRAAARSAGSRSA